MKRIGLISDTHGLLRGAALARLEGVDIILHAGDVGGGDILVELATIAPVTAVLGNTDGFELRDRLGEEERLEVEGRRIVLVHGHRLGTPTPQNLRAAYPAADIIVYGHTHRPRIDRAADAALVINPGAAGARRFDIRPSVGLLTLDGAAVDVELVELED